MMQTMMRMLQLVFRSGWEENVDLCAGSVRERKKMEREREKKRLI